MSKTITPEGAMRLAEAIRLQVDGHKEQGMIAAAKYLLMHAASKKPEGDFQVNQEYAEEVLRKFVQHLLDKNLFVPAATILWGKDVFDWRPKFVRDVWRCIWNHDKLAVPGSGACGKTFCGGAWFYLDWWRDPEYTCIKVISATKEHAEKNIFASMQNFHRRALVRPLGCDQFDLATAIQCNSDAKQGIHLVAIAKGEGGHGVLRGFHPTPRYGKEHPKWGKLSRVFVLLDEAETIPPGVWEGVDNIASTIDSEGAKGAVKIYAATNPKDRSSSFGQRCEPTKGWNSIEINNDWEWESKMGWHVLRLDAMQSENVVQKKIVYPGFQTYEGYMSYMANGLTAIGSTMARGWFPSEGMAMGIFTPAMMDNAVGILRFIGPVVPLAAFDLALMGDDNIVCTYGRWGLADGWTPQSGQFIPFDTAKHAIQCDSQVKFPKGDTVAVVDRIKRWCEQMKIKATWLCVDRTGNGAGVHDLLRNKFGKDVMGVNYSEAATDSKVMGEDTKTAAEQYDGVVTELLFAMSRYIEFGLLKISPSFRNEHLIKQATGRRFRQKGIGLVRCQSKKDYMQTTQQRSPDELDSMTLFVHLFRMRSGETPLMDKKNEKRERNEGPKRASFDDLEFIDFSE